MMCEYAGGVGWLGQGRGTAKGAGDGRPELRCQWVFLDRKCTTNTGTGKGARWYGNGRKGVFGIWGWLLYLHDCWTFPFVPGNVVGLGGSRGDVFLHFLKIPSASEQASKRASYLGGQPSLWGGSPFFFFSFLSSTTTRICTCTIVGIWTWIYKTTRGD